jgi:NAD+ synthase (glutamine-hydrolysing)
MKIFLAQQNYIIGDFEYNKEKIIGAVRRAVEQGGDLIVFSELAVCGYPPRDFLEFDEFIASCLASIDAIREETASIAVLVGAPSVNPKVEGKDLFNSAYFLYEKEIKQVVHKTLLPNYDIFDECRYFEPASSWETVSFKGKKLAVTICEDIWDLVEDPLYMAPPMEKLMQQQPDIMINLSASPFDYTHAEDRLAMAKRNALQYHLPLLYCNAVGSQTEIVFDGGSLVLDAEGNLIKEMDFFREELFVFDWDGTGRYAGPFEKAVKELPDKELEPQTFLPELNIHLIHDALITGIREYFSKMGFLQAIVASSGGIDSAVTLALACEALGHQHVRALLLPSEFSTDHSVSDAEQLSRNLDNPFDLLSIKSIFETVRHTLRPVFKDLPFGLAEENIQSRIRGMLAMALSN